MSYIVAVILLDIILIIGFFVRKKKAGIIIKTVSLSRIKYFDLITGFFFIILGFKSIYSLTPILGDYLSDSQSVTNIIIILAGTFFIISFFASKIHLGTKGISVPKFPYFIANDEISNYDFLSNMLILIRKGGKEYKIRIDINDVKAMKSVLLTLK